MAGPEGRTMLSPLVFGRPILDDVCFRLVSMSQRERLRHTTIGADADDVKASDDKTKGKKETVTTENGLGSRNGAKPRRRRHKRDRQEADREWPVVIRMDWRENTLDKRTIYSDRNDKLLTTLEHRDEIMLSPLEYSPRMADRIIDSQDLTEKVLVLKHNLSVGRKTRYHNGRGFLPVVNPVSSFNPDHTPDRHSADKHCGLLSVYCDVIGRKYCSFCQELENKRLARSYEPPHLPKIDRSNGSLCAGNSKQLPSRGRLLPASLPDQMKSLRNNTLLMPITYIPREGETLQGSRDT